MSLPEVRIAGIGLWLDGLPDWAAACAYARGGSTVDGAPRRPAPQLLAPNERRRAPETVAVALDVALAACQAAGADPASVPSVFASANGEMSITDYMCQTLASDPASLSPTRFHNSVHNAAAGYWTIASGAMEPATALSAGRAGFAMGLLEAAAQLQAGAPAALLVGYDGASPGLLRELASSEGLLGVALVLAPTAAGGRTLALSLEDGEAPVAPERVAPGNAMAPALALFEALARGDGSASLPAGEGRRLRLDLGHG